MPCVSTNKTCSGLAVTRTAMTSPACNARTLNNLTLFFSKIANVSLLSATT
ncbi:uncharacterized protein J3R85_002190 [Psidium guajava]|nr:uncharacterized protein J3R85_002190 [Psidium guajava]